MKSWKTCCLLLSTLIFSATTWSAASPTVKQPYIKVSLLSDVDQLAKGQSAHVGLFLRPDPGWHVYWINPGDSGQAPALSWKNVTGINMGSIQWPFPKRIPVQNLMNYGYKGDVLLPIPIEATELINDEEVTLQAQANWLVCKDTCVPGKAELSLTLPVRQKKPRGRSPQQILFKEALRTVPATLPLQGAPVKLANDKVSIQLYAKSGLFDQARTIKFFPITESLVDYSIPPKLSWHSNVLRINQAKSAEFTDLPPVIEGVIVINDKTAWRFKVPST